MEGHHHELNGLRVVIDGRQADHEGVNGYAKIQMGRGVPSGITVWAVGGGRNGVGDVPFGVKHTTIYKAP